MTHIEAVRLALEKEAQGTILRHPLNAYMLTQWGRKKHIPLIYIGEVACLIGVKPSEIDPAWKGKDNDFINFEEKK